jgi:hypothetical protein
MVESSYKEWEKGGGNRDRIWNCQSIVIAALPNTPNSRLCDSFIAYKSTFTLPITLTKFKNSPSTPSLSAGCTRARLQLRAPPLAVALVRLPVGILAWLAAVPRLLACWAPLDPRAAAAGIGAVRLRLEVRSLLGGGPNFFRDGCRRGSDAANVVQCTCLCVGTFLNQLPYQVRMLAERGCHQRRTAIMPCSVYVSAELLDEALHNSHVAILCSHVHGRASILISLVDVSA